MLFEKLGLIAPIQEAVTELGYTKPTPVQSKVIPLVLEGKDVMATAQTGTGKTAAYALPLLQILSKKTQKSTTKKVVRALILVPTRELASQVALNVQAYGKNLELTIGAIYGGVKFTPQVKKLEKGIDAKTMASLAGVLTPAINRIKDTCKKTNTTLVLVNQVRSGLS